ncbi:hypothetical protein NDU88_001430 [Pleurodeles waltl]|uniref:Uncharacterized protein n=1 Tax=Pleurodeles waltl TaxID=8319 RepID=A0AAV7VBN5_PLEWA|nr:hypothetical protein NDU88_001430 [Pleurodeles waltl]
MKHPRGFLATRRRPWSGLRRSRGEKGVRPGRQGGAAERRERRPGPRDGLSPGGPFEPGAEGSGGSLWAPERLDCAVGLGPETPERPEGEGRSHMCYWIGGCRTVLFTLAPMSGAS